jgi:hypothetical protein
MIPLGNLAGGVAAQWIGPRGAIACGGLILLFAGLRFGTRRSQVEAAL